MAAVGPRSSSWLLAALAGAAVLLVRRARRRYRSSSVWHVTTAFSRRLRAVPPNPFDDLIPLMQRPGASVLAQGVPPHSCSPLASASFTLTNGASIELDAAEMALAQRYAPFAWAGLKAWLREHVQQQHAPPLASWSVSLAAGSMSSVDLAIAMLVDPGDVVLLEEFSFTAGTHHTPPLTHHLFQPTASIQPLPYQPLTYQVSARSVHLVPALCRLPTTKTGWFRMRSKRHAWRSHVKANSRTPSLPHVTSPFCPLLTGFGCVDSYEQGCTPSSFTSCPSVRTRRVADSPRTLYFYFVLFCVCRLFFVFGPELEHSRSHSEPSPQTVAPTLKLPRKSLSPAHLRPFLAPLGAATSTFIGSARGTGSSSSRTMRTTTCSTAPTLLRAHCRGCVGSAPLSSRSTATAASCASTPSPSSSRPAFGKKIPTPFPICGDPISPICQKTMCFCSFFRLGWVSGASSLVEAYDRVAYTSSQARAQEKRRSQPVALISAHCPAPPHAAPHAARRRTPRRTPPHAAARRRTPPQPRRTVAYRTPAFGSAVSVQTHAAAPSPFPLVHGICFRPPTHFSHMSHPTFSISHLLFLW